jgi:hypothetical protein
MPDTPSDSRPDAVTDPCSVNVGTSTDAKALEGCDLKGGQVLKFYYETPDAPAVSEENIMNPALPPVVAAAPPAETHASAPADPVPALPADAEGNAAVGNAVAAAPATGEHTEVAAAGPSAG